MYKYIYIIYNGYFYWNNCGEITDGKLGEMTDGDFLRDRGVMRYSIKKIWFENDLFVCLKTAMVPTTENTYFIGLFGKHLDMYILKISLNIDTI